jgi:hypothetical protein
LATSKCGYGVEQKGASEQTCVGCHFLLEYPQGGQFCDWRETDGADALNGPSNECVETFGKKPSEQP